MVSERHDLEIHIDSGRLDSSVDADGRCRICGRMTGATVFDDILDEPGGGAFAELTCNGCGFRVTAAFPDGVSMAQSAEAILSAAQADGWASVGNLDYCPTCAPRKARAN